MKAFLSMIPASALAVALLASAAPAAEREAAGDRNVRGDKRYSDRDRMSNWDQGKKQLEQSLKPGLDKTAYRKELEKLGFQVTAVNYDSPDYVEYEVVKGDQSYEIQIDMKGGKAEKVEIATNMWKADTTKQALEGKKLDEKQMASARDGKRYSDRDQMSNWDQGKKQLEQALKTGLDKNAYRQQIEKLGYKITAVNYDDPDYVEYEVVKGNQSYEVQIDFNKDTRKASKVEVETNMWKAEATERALQTAEGGRAGQERGATVGRTGEQRTSGDVRTGSGSSQTSRTERESGAAVSGGVTSQSGSQAGRTGEQRASGEVRSGSQSSGMEGQPRTSERAGSMRAEGQVTTVSAEEVRELQQALKEKGHDPGPIDGVMGPQTQQALRQFQQANGIQATGTLNAETKERLGLEAKAKTWEKTQVEGNRESGGGAGAAPGLP